MALPVMEPSWSHSFSWGQPPFPFITIPPSDPRDDNLTPDEILSEESYWPPRLHKSSSPSGALLYATKPAFTS